MTKQNTGGKENGTRRNRDTSIANSRRLSQLARREKPEICEIELTTACNLHCIHCYANAGQVSSQEITNDEIIKLLDQNKSIKSVILTGGEPFLRKDIMELIKLISARDIDVSINTNGLLLTKERVERLHDLKVKTIQISIDGLERTHDIIRGLKGCFKKSVKAVKLCLDKGIRVEIGTVLTRLNKDEVPDILKMCKRLGVQKFSVDLFIPTGRAIDNDLKISLDEYVRVIRNITDISKINPEKLLRPRCGVGYKKVVVAANGNIVPCVAMSSLIAGNIKTHELSKVFASSRIFKKIREVGKIQECSRCSSKLLCCGGCRARALAINGRIQAPDPAHCALFSKV